MLTFAAALPLAIVVSRADRQRRAVVVIEQHEGIVAFDNEIGFYTMVDDYLYTGRHDSIIQNLTRTVTTVRIELPGYGMETRNALSELASLEYIYVMGADSARAKKLIEPEFPTVNVVDLRSDLMDCLH